MRFFRTMMLAVIIFTLAACQTDTNLPGEDHGSDSITEGKSLQAKVVSVQGTLPPYPTPLPTSYQPIPTTAVPVNPTSSPSTPTRQNPTQTPITTSLPATPTSLPPTATVASSATYRIQSGNPSRMSNFTHPDAGCNWIGVAGQAFDENGKPVSSLAVSVKGTFGSTNIDLLSVTGSAPAYGPGGYEVILGTKPLATTGKLVIQLLDASAKPLTEKIAFDTSADCAENLILINFVPIHLLPDIYIPLISQK